MLHTAYFRKELGLIKEEIADYYNVFFSSQIAPPICITFCLVIIVYYVLFGFGNL